MTTTAPPAVDRSGGPPARRPGAGWRRPGDRLLLWLVGEHVLLVAVLLAPGRRVPASGDENYYLGAAQTLAALVRQLVGPAPLDHTAFTQQVVGDGWFMPGLSVLLTPLYLVAPHASLGQVRVYTAVLNVVVFVAALLVVRARLGPRYAVAVAVLPGLLPMWALFSMAAWGDAPAGMVVVVLAAEITALLRGARAGVTPRVRDGVRVGVLCAVCLYLRSSSLPLVLVALVVAALGAAVLLPRARPRTGPRPLLRAAMAGAAAVAVFGLLLAPWSWAASEAFGTRVTTTTTIPISLGITFGDPQRMCFGPCPGHNPWYGAVGYSRAVAERTGLSPVEVQRQMSAYARQQVTPSSYAEDVIGDTHRYVLEPTSFIARFEPSVPGWLAGLVVASTRILYGVGLVALGWALLAVPRRSAERQVVSILVKALTAAIMVQPFVHISHGRYWPVFAPLMGLAVGLLVSGRAPRDDADPPRRVLTVVQLLGTVAWVAVPVAVVLVASAG